MAEIQLERGTVPPARDIPEWRELEGSEWGKSVSTDVDKRATATRRNRFYNEWPFDVHRQIARWSSNDFLGQRRLTGSRLKAYEDKHRYRLGTPRHFYEDVVRPTLRYGDLFEIEGTYLPGTLGQWRDSIARLNRARYSFATYRSRLSENAPGMQHAIPAAGLDKLATDFLWVVSDEGPLTLTFIAGSPGISLRADSLLGWCWLNVLRDHWEYITYNPCKAECGHEVPSLSMPTKRFRQGRAVTFCGTACRSTARLKVQKNRLTELEVRIAELEAKPQ